MIIGILLVFTLFTAYSTKPDDRTCVTEVAKAVWGRIVPKETKPMYYEQFMDLTSKSIGIDDWIFLKRVQYKFNNGNTTVAFAAFKRVFIIRKGP